jgi:hypothetical protein
MVEKINNQKLRLKVRFDYRGEGKSGRVFWRNKEGEQVAEEIREQKAILLRNIPIQGVQILEINTNGEIYTVRDDGSGRDVAFAPIEFIVEADTIEDVLSFLLREEFRKIEVLHPAEFTLDRHEIERIIYKMNEELRTYRLYLEKRLASK